MFNLRFSPSKWRWVRSMYVGQGGIKRDFEQFLLRYASLELDHWLRLWIPHYHTPHRLKQTANEYASEITWYLHVPIAKKSCEAMRDVFLNWQNPCLLDLGRLLADSLEMFLTLLLAQSFAVKNFFFIVFFWPATQTQKEIGETYLQRHPSFSCWGQSNRMNIIPEIVPERAASVPLPAALSPPPEAGTQRTMLGHNFETYAILQANPFRCCLCWWPCYPSDPRSLELLSAGLPVSLHTLPQSAQGRRYAMD